MKAANLNSIDSPVRPAPLAGRRAASSGSLLASLGALYGLTLRQHLHGKRWLVVGGLFLLPALLAGLVRATVPKESPALTEFVFVFMFIPQALLPLVALLYGSGIVKDELEDQTFTYLLIRPIPRWAIYLVKVLATLTTTVVLTTIFTSLTYATIYVGVDAGGENIPLRCLKAIGVHALAVATYCCLFGLMSLLTRWTLVLGILYTAFFEGFLANMPFSVRLLTVLYYSRLIAYRSMSFLVTGPRGNKENIAADAWQLDVRADPLLLEHPQMGTCLIVMLGASLIFMVWGAYLCSRREFHVKTPEGS
jgi:ABC-2 type transport system permease protein